jgi:uncharacterized membrane protein
MRGLACLLMFQTHCYDSWLSPAARRTTFFMWSQMGGTLPAPLFLFLAGFSFALVTDKSLRRGVAPAAVASTTIRRGAEILGFGLLFRLQQFAFNWRWAPWTDLLRVDILNTIGVSMMLMGVVCWICGVLPVWRTEPAEGAGQYRRYVYILVPLAVAAAISLLTPPLWTTHRLRWLPWPLESYINGVHTFGEPKGYFFPIFPWAGFAFVGLALGFFALSDWVKRRDAAVFALLGVLGAGCIWLGRWFDHQPRHFYAVYSFWTTSPEFFLMRIGMLLLIALLAYAWCRWGAASWGYSPFLQLGQTSLLVYWVHIEFVYGRMIILPSHANTIARATAGLVFITGFMLVLAALRLQLKQRKKQAAAPMKLAQNA